jgi:hypothetical protein
MKAKPLTDLEKAIRKIVTDDQNPFLLMSKQKLRRGSTLVAMGSLIPQCPFCKCSAVMISIINDEMDALAAIECVQCGAFTTSLELLGAWEWGGWQAMRRSRR